MKSSASHTSPKRRQGMAIVIASCGLVSAVAVMFGLVPRIRLVEAVSLFATFAAGAGIAVLVADMRAGSSPAPA